MQGNDDSPEWSERPLTLQEALRTLGLALEVVNPRRVVLHIDLDGIRADVPGVYGTCFHSWDDLLIQRRSWRAGRATKQPRRLISDPWSLRRWSVLLRAAGALLDQYRTTCCVLRASAVQADPPQDATVEVIADGRQIFDTFAVRQYILRRRLRDTHRSEARATPHLAAL
jgi:hypothetical protein